MITMLSDVPCLVVYATLRVDTRVYPQLYTQPVCLILDDLAYTLLK